MGRPRSKSYTVPSTFGHVGKTTRYIGERRQKYRLGAVSNRLIGWGEGNANLVLLDPDPRRILNNLADWVLLSLITNIIGPNR